MIYLRRLVLVPAVLIALITVGLVPAGPAQAQSLAEIEAEIDDAWRALEPLIEEHNKVRSELEANQEASAKLAGQIAPLVEQVAQAEAELADLAVAQFQTGPLSAFNALLSSGSPTTFVDRLAVLNQLAHQQRQLIEDTNQTRTEFEGQQTEIDELIAEQLRQEADLAERAEQIEQDLANLEDLKERALREQAQRQAQQQAQPQAETGGTASTGACPAVAGSGPGAVAAEFACSQLGKPYQWGASGPGSYDCSGLTQQAWAAAGVRLTHYTGAQWNEGRAVSRADAVVGDLVFFYSGVSHVGLYIGGGLMVHSPRPGTVVNISSIDTMPISGFRRPG